MNAAVRNIETTQRIAMRVVSTAFVAEDVIAVDLVPTGSDPLPPFEAGAHIELFLPNGLARCYSLVNPLADLGVYRVVVQRDRASRGASAYIVDHLRAGAELVVTEPRNNFALVDGAPHVRLIAGGIGITPLWAMAQVLAARAASWDLFYAARSRANAVFAESLSALSPDCTRFHFDDVQGDKLSRSSSAPCRGTGRHAFLLLRTEPHACGIRGGGDIGTTRVHSHRIFHR